MLGPLEVIDDAGAALPLGACRQRAVLAVLVRRAARVTPVADLIDAVYGLKPPPSASNAVQVYVSSLRKLLGPDRVAHHPPGYMLAAEPEEIDLGRFDRLVAEARVAQARGDLSGAVDLLGEAQQLVRGRPFADLVDLEFADRAAAAIQERIDAALRLRIDAQLALGGHAALLGELSAAESAPAPTWPATPKPPRSLRPRGRAELRDLWPQVLAVLPCLSQVSLRFRVLCPQGRKRAIDARFTGGYVRAPSTRSGAGRDCDRGGGGRGPRTRTPSWH